MAWPSWFAQGSRPSTWVDWAAAFRKTVPREWPRNLFADESEGFKDLVAFGEALALSRDMLNQVMAYIWPARDSVDGVFVDDWEGAFNLRPGSADLDERIDRLIAAFRQRGTLSADQTKAILSYAFGSADPADVSIEIANATDLASAWAAGDTSMNAGLSYLFTMNCVHVYHTSESVAPDQDLLEYLISRIKPAWEFWSGGQYNRLKWGVAGAEGAWDQATWG